MPQEPQQLETTDSDRDLRGRFAPGNQAARGPRIAAKSTSYLRALKLAVSADEIAEIGRAMYAKAIDGDIRAAKLLFEYLLPRPVEHLTIDGSLVDPSEHSTKTEFRRAGANWATIDREVLQHLGRLIEEQEQYERGVAEHQAKLEAQKR